VTCFNMLGGGVTSLVLDFDVDLVVGGFRPGLVDDCVGDDEFLRVAPKPIPEPEERREAIIFSKPTNAPAKTKRIFVVSIVYCSPFPPLELSR